VARPWVAVLLLAVTPAIGVQGAAKRPRKKTVKAAPVISPQERNEAVKFVSSRAALAIDSIENPAALVPFFLQLGNANGPLHILQYGDSHTASDDWTNTMRQSLQSRFGNGGAGYTLPGSPFRGYRRWDIRGTGSSGWQTEGTLGHLTDGRYGLAGVSISTNQPGETVTLTTACAALKMFYLRQPGGGELDFLVDGGAAAKISTNGELGSGTFEFFPPPGQHEYSLATRGNAPVKLFGWAADNRNGVTYETLGINGAQAYMMLDWDEAVLSEHMAQRNPALILLEYGTNEAISPGWTPAKYAAELSRVLDRVRHLAPLASILLVGPPDCYFRMRNGQFFPAHLSEVVEIQREIAFQHRCAFWDLRARMGGAGSVEGWVQAGYGQSDHVHFTKLGYQLVGEMLTEELLEQYRRFQAVKTE
jgi:lysophospholipase L1-like esterase